MFSEHAATALLSFAVRAFDRGVNLGLFHRNVTTEGVLLHPSPIEHAVAEGSPHNPSVIRGTLSFVAVLHTRYRNLIAFLEPRTPAFIAHSTGRTKASISASVTNMKSVRSTSRPRKSFKIEQNQVRSRRPYPETFFEKLRKSFQLSL